MLTLPTFFIIGAAKAGTTSLHQYLDLHPEVQMSAVKEPNFFAGPAGGIPYPQGRIERLDEYESLFDPSYEVRGEASPSYTSAPRRSGVPERIRGAAPGAKFVYLVRDPIARTISQYTMLVAAGKERSRFRDCVAGIDLASPQAHYLTCQSLYAQQLERYLRCFAQERILVVDQAELLADRRVALGRIFGFLSVDSAFDSPQFDAEHFRGDRKRAYPPLVTRFVKPALWRLPAGLKAPLRRSFERTLPRVEAPALDQETRARLEQIYAPEVDRLRSLTGQAFAGWSL